MTKQIEHRLQLLEKDDETIKTELKKLNEVKQNRYYPWYGQDDQKEKSIGRGPNKLDLP